MDTVQSAQELPMLEEKGSLHIEYASIQRGTYAKPEFKDELIMTAPRQIG